MQVKCKYTGESVDKKIAFRVVLEGAVKGTYFKSEKEYKAFMADIESKNKIQLYVNEIFNKLKFTNLSPIVDRKIKKWINEGYTYQEIEYTLYHFKDELKTFRIKGETYIVQVIENKLLKGREIIKLKAKDIKIEINDDVENKINNHKYNKKGVDIRQWM